MTTAALLQATSVLDTPTIISSVWNAAGAPGGQFDTTPTDIIVSAMGSNGLGLAVFRTEFRAIAAVVLNAPGVGTPNFQGFTIVTGPVVADLVASGSGAAFFIGRDAQLPPELDEPIKVRFITGPVSGVIPVEIVDEPGPDVIEVQLLGGRDNYVPIVVDPTNPMRKKVHFVEEP